MQEETLFKKYHCGLQLDMETMLHALQLYGCLVARLVKLKGSYDAA
jgi:hypothetical protein